MKRALGYAAGGMIAMIVLGIFTTTSGQITGAVVYIVMILGFCTQEILNSINGHKK